MSQDSTSADLVELTRRSFEAAKSHDVDAIMDFFAPDAVWDLSDLGLGTFEGEAAIRAFVEDWFGTWGEHIQEVQEIVDVGRGVVFSPVREEGRLAGSEGRVEQRRGWVTVWVRGKIARTETYLNVDEGRAAAEHLAHERR